MRPRGIINPFPHFPLTTLHLILYEVHRTQVG